MSGRFSDCAIRFGAQPVNAIARAANEARAIGYCCSPLNIQIVIARFMRATQYFFKDKLSCPDKPGNDKLGVFGKIRPHRSKHRRSHPASQLRKIGRQQLTVMRFR